MLAKTAAIAGILLASAARADTYTVSVSNPMDLGQVAAAPTGSTVFQVVPQSGQVNGPISGTGHRLSTSLVRVLVTISCKASNNQNGQGNQNNQGNQGNGSACKNNKVSVVIGDIGVTTGRAQPLTNFTVSMTSASLSGSVVGTNPIIFILKPIGAGQTASFYLGANFPVAGDDSGASSGLGLSPYYVYVTDTSGAQLASTLSSGSVTAYHALTVNKTSDLQFGTVSQAKTSGTVTIDPTTGNRTITGGGFGYPTPAWTAAALTISGEGGQAFSVSFPKTVQLTGKTNINVTTTSNLPASPTLSNGLGSAGTFALKIGGSFPIAAGSIIGTYSGSFTVTVNYN